MDTGGRPFVIIGGGLAAAEAAKTLRAEGYDGGLIVLAAEPFLPYERPPLTKGYLRGEEPVEKLLAQSAAFYEEGDIEVLTGRRATGLDTAARTVTLADGTVLGYERLLLATGSTAIRPGLPGIDLPWVHLLRTIADADRLRESLRGAGAVAVAGGGWIAAEAAASLRQLGLEVTLIVPGAEILERHLGPVAPEITAVHERHGVRVVRSSRVAAIEEAGGRRGLRLSTGERVEADLAVVGFGAAPAVELGIAAGLEVMDGIVADARLATSAEGVFVAGDVAAAWHPRYGERVRSEHWDNARRQGRTAARNMLGRDEAYERIPYFFSDQLDLGLELFGRPAGAEDAVVRREEGGVVAVWLRDGRVVAAMHTNLWDTRKALDKLVSTGAPLDLGAFADTAVPLADALATHPGVNPAAGG